MTQFNANRENLPNPSKLLDSLRYTGYDNYNAILDIVDNCIDADAQNIWINIIEKNGDITISIADNGVGMSYEILDQALKLGSETEKEIDSDLGRFGMGLSTASLSICKRTTVLTKSKNGELLKSETDLDWVKERNVFEKFLDKSPSAEKKEFDEFIHNNNSGTVVILSKCDRIQNKDIRVFSNTLQKHTGRVFRRFIEAGKKFYINNKVVETIDPLMLDEPNTRIYSDEVYPIQIQKGNIIYDDSIRIRMVILPDFGKAGNTDRGVNYFNQGFYVMRNERELFAGSNLDGVFTKDAHLNRFRAEIYFSGTLDDLVGVHFTKRSVSLDQGLKDKIKEVTRSQIRQIGNIADKERPTDEQNISHSDSEKIISKKSKLLLKPPTQPEKKKPRFVNKETEVNKRKESESISDRLRLICRFEERSMDKVGPLYSPSMIGKKVVVTWNSDHPFYKLIIEKKEDKTFVTSLDFLIYSLASAELKAINDENVSLLEEIRQDMSHNLKVLVD
jgi:hypothetical protein